MISNETIGKYFEKISPKDLESSATLRTFRKQPKLLKRILIFIDRFLNEKERMCDLGCGYGFLSSLIGNLLGFKEVYGMDINDERLSIAEKRLHRTFKINLESDVFPFPDGYFDLVSSFGVLEHLRFFDNTIDEACRTLKSQGLLFISIPSLGDWVDRLRLLIGLQPHSVQISRHSPIDHIHSCTLNTLERLLMNHGFTPLKAYGARATYRSNKALEALDNLFSKRPSLSIRVFLVAQKKY